MAVVSLQRSAGREGILAAAERVSIAAAGRAAALDHDGAYPADDIAHLHQTGLLAAPLPAAHRGRGLIEPDQVQTLCAVLRAIGYGSLPLGRLYEGHVNAIRLLLRHGTSELIARVATEVHAGDLLGVWNTDDSGGLKLEPDGQAWRLAGRKILASGAGFIRRPLVTARMPDDTLVMVMPHLDDDDARADLSRWTVQGMRASATGSVDFTGISVSTVEIVGAHEDYLRQPAFSGGAWRFAAVHLGGIEAMFDQLRQHLRQTGRCDDPHQRARVGTAAIAVETARLWVERAARIAEEEQMSADAIVAYVNLTRLAVERCGLDVLELVQRSIGLQAFVRPHPVERIARDLATYLRQPAPDRALVTAAGHVLDRDEAAGALWI